MEEQPPSFLLRGTRFDLQEFLSRRTSNCNYPDLVRNGDRNTSFRANQVMNGKVVMLCFFSLPLPSHAVAVAQAVSLVSSEMHDFGAFELIIFLDYFTDCDDQDAALAYFFSFFPSFCLISINTNRLGPAMPLACYPHGLLVNRAKKVEWHKPLDFLFKYGVDAFPFTSEWLSLISQREETAMAYKSWRSLYNFLCSMPLTFPSHSTSLTKNPGGGTEKVRLYDLKDKCVGLYLCQTGNLIPTLDNVHRNCCELGLEFEIILVYMPFGYDGDPQSFQDFINYTLKERNISWWVFPFINWVSRRLSRLFHQDADDRLIIIDPKSKYVEFHGEAVICHHGASAYPFSSQLLVNREVERLRAVTLQSLLVYSSLDYVLWMGSGFTHRVPVAALQGKTVFLYLHCAKVTIYDLDHKCVGLYLCQTGNLIPTLDNVHITCCELGLEFEIILVYMPFSCSGDPQLFQDRINCTLKERKISWWVFPFINWVSRRLSRLFHQDADDRLIIIDPKSKYVEFHGEAVIRHHGASAYPFSSQLLVNREVERLRAVTLASLFVYRSLDYVLWMGSGFTHRVPVKALQGKTVFLYLHCSKDNSFNCFDKLVSYCQMKAVDPNFEMVFVGLDTSSAPDVGHSCEMPWLVYPWDPNHSDYVTRTIFGKGDKCSTIIAFGKDGLISSIRALRLVCSSCPDFPLRNNLHNEMSAELTGSKVVRAVPSNLNKYCIESLNHVKALFPLLGEEYFFPGLPVRWRTKPSEEMHDFYDCVDDVERTQYLASKTDYIAVIEENAQYPKAIIEGVANIDTSNFDVISFLSADNRQYLVRNDGCHTQFEVERLWDKKWVMICCLSCPIYFNSKLALVYRGISDMCSELYDEYGDTFEMVLVCKMSRDFEADESSFRHMLSGFPQSCLVVPFWDSDSRDSICCSLGFSRPPQGLFLRADERKVIWHKTLFDMQDYGVDTFPFTKDDFLKKSDEEYRKSWNVQSLEELFDCSSAENPGGANYYEKMSMKQLQKKLVGVYLCLRGDSIPMLHELHQVCKANNIEFEIVVVCCLFTAKNSNPELFQDQIKSALRKRNISWWVLPYKGSMSRKLVRLLRSPIEEELIIVGNGVVDPDGAYFIRQFRKLQKRRRVSSSSDGSGLLDSLILEFKSKYHVEM